MIKPEVHQQLLSVLQKYKVLEYIDGTPIIEDPDHCSIYTQYVDYGPDAPDIWDFSIFHNNTLLLHAQIDADFRKDLGKCVEEVIPCPQNIPQ